MARRICRVCRTMWLVNLPSSLVFLAGEEDQDGIVLLSGDPRLFSRWCTVELIISWPFSRAWPQLALFGGRQTALLLRVLEGKENISRSCNIQYDISC